MAKPEEDPKVGIHDLRDLLLITAWADPADISSVEELRLAVMQWRSELEVTGHSLVDSARIERLPGVNDFSSLPCWNISLEEKLPEARHASLPLGPFVEKDGDLLFASVNSALVEWLGDKSLSDVHSTDNSYRIVLTDPRGFFVSLRAIANDLHIRMSPDLPSGTSCLVFRTGFSGEFESKSVPVEAEEISVTFDAAVKELDLWLVTDSGEKLDHYQEREGFVSRGAGLYNRPTNEDPRFALLEEALTHGESEEVEFKEWIAVETRDRKTPELLKTSCAFANTAGGWIYIGVTDNAEVVGTRTRLTKDYPQMGREAAEDRYIGDLRRFISEGVRPQLRPEFDWVGFAALRVLRIRIPPSDSVRSVAETGDYYVRRGGTSRKVRPDEMTRDEWSRPRRQR